jgi:hypothetical protein
MSLVAVARLADVIRKPQASTLLYRMRRLMRRRVQIRLPRECHMISYGKSLCPHCPRSNRCRIICMRYDPGDIMLPEWLLDSL